MTTHFQEKLYQFISEHLVIHGRSPSYLEMTAAMGISPKSKSLITRSLKALNKIGKIKLKKEGRNIVITLTEKGVPLIGKISAGMPIEAIEEKQFIDIEDLLQGEGRFALQVKGNSMIEDGIFDGDLIMCRKAQLANEGEIVVALIDGFNTTLKRISFKTKGVITLVPSNVEMKPQTYSSERIEVQGIYIGLIRLS
jgi:repressor LexA